MSFLEDIFFYFYTKKKAVLLFCSLNATSNPLNITARVPVDQAGQQVIWNITYKQIIWLKLDFIYMIGLRN